MINNEFHDWEGILIAENASRIVGFCSFVGKYVVDLAYSSYIATVYIDPYFWRNGISKELVTIAEEKLLNAGFQTVYNVT